MRSLLLFVAIGCGESSKETKPRVPPPTAPSPVTRPRLVAHRGASHDQPENTLAAFRRAWELGVECAELDMRVTKDGEVVVIHDADTKRVGGVDRKVVDQTLAELRTLDVGRGEKIPTIAEALDSIPAGRTLFLEIKTLTPTVPTVAKAILAHDPRPRGGTIALQAFDAEALAALAKALPGVTSFWDVDPPGDGLPYTREVIDAAKAHGFTGLALDYRGVTPDFARDARAAGLEVDVWTINDATELATWLARDIRWVETDRPDLVPPR